jgi:hypothetical protein
MSYARIGQSGPFITADKNIVFSSGYGGILCSELRRCENALEYSARRKNLITATLHKSTSRRSLLPVLYVASRSSASVVPVGLNEVSYTYCVSSTGVSKDTVVSFNATRSARKFIPIIVQLWMTAVLFVFMAVRVLASGTFQNLLHRGTPR